MPMRAAASDKRPLRVSSSHSATAATTASTAYQGSMIHTTSATASNTIDNRFHNH
ncbi:hypothetical protein D3C81_2334590 [compost metagenome]